MVVKKGKERISNLVSKFVGNEQKTYRHDSYSQCGEDLIVDFIFKTIGINQPSYIDIGAHHPFRFNNTAIFYARGCRGINIEPDPVLFSKFLKYRNSDINLNIGIAHETSTLTFNIMSTPAMNTFSADEAKRLEEKFGITLKKRIEVKVEPLNKIIADFNNNFFPEFLSIDVEGMDDVILKDINYEKGPIVICAETLSFEEDGTGKKNNELIDFLITEDYMVYADTYINTIFVKKNKWKMN